MKRELGVSAMYRELVELGETYTLWKQSEAYVANFAYESDALMPDNAILWEEKL